MKWWQGKTAHLSSSGEIIYRGIEQLRTVHLNCSNPKLTKWWQGKAAHLKPQSHISTDVHGSPGSAGSRRIIRAHFEVFERRRSYNGRHDGGKTAATRDEPGQTRTKTAATRNQHGAHTDDHGSSRTVTAVRTDQHGRDTDSPEWTRTNTAFTRTIPDLPGGYTDRPGCCHLPGPSRTYRAVLNFPKLPCWPPRKPQGPSRTFKDQPGITADHHGGYTVHTPDRAGCDPCLIRHLYWDWGLSCNIFKKHF